MATTSPTPRCGRARCWVARVRVNLPTAELYEDAIRRGRGPGRRRRAARRPDRQAHRPLARGQVHRPRAGAPRRRSGGARSTGRSARSTTTGSGRASSTTRATRDLYSQDCFIGAAPAHRRSLRVYTETAWASIFARNLFRRPTADAAGRLQPELHDHLRPVVPGRPGDRGDAHRDRDPRPPRADGGDHRRHRVRRRDQEVRVHGHELPDARRGRAADALGDQRRRGRRRRRLLRPVGDRQDDPVGRSAAQPHRRRRARLGRRTASSTSRAAATPRRSASRRCTSRTSSRPRSRFGTILENVDLDPATRELDLDSERFTENTRGAYPLEFIGNADPTGIAGHAADVVFLTADAFGVLPPISRLTREQAAYHFISGYTAKLAGTEVGVKEPKATFSACFGAPFMPRHPGEYARDAGRAPASARTSRSGWSTPAGPAGRTAPASG